MVWEQKQTSTETPCGVHRSLYCGCSGEGCVGCKDAIHCILSARTLWPLAVALPRGTALGVDVN